MHSHRHYTHSKLSANRVSRVKRDDKLARHSLFPGFIKFRYTSNTHVHHQVLPIAADPTPSGDSYTIPKRSGGSVDWQDAADAWAILLAALLGDDGSVELAELYNFEAEPGPADFLAAHPLDVAGSGGGAAVPWVQVVMPFKGVGGTQLRITTLEGNTPANIHDPYSILAPPYTTMIDFVLGADDWIVTRAGGYPTVSLGLITKINDQLRKRYFNP